MGGGGWRANRTVREVVGICLTFEGAKVAARGALYPAYRAQGGAKSHVDFWKEVKEEICDSGVAPGRPRSFAVSIEQNEDWEFSGFHSNDCILRAFAYVSRIKLLDVPQGKRVCLRDA